MYNKCYIAYVYICIIMKMFKQKMENTTHTPAIEITRSDGKLSNVLFKMPVWKRFDKEGNTYVKFGLLGGIETYSKTPEDLEDRISEALTLFCHAAEKTGLGLEDELSFMGWTVSTLDGNSFLSVDTNNIALNSVLETGDDLCLTI
jgi:predicted RNase H-like HicB family nuclease